MKKIFLILFIIITNTINIKAQLPTGYENTIDAIHYNIHLDEINISAKTLKAHTEAVLVAKTQNLPKIYLELIKLTVDSVFVNGVKSTNFAHTSPLLEILLSNPINLNDTIRVITYYHGVPFVDASGWGGFHFTSSSAFNLGVGFKSIPHNLGKAWFPCIDSFTDKANFDVYITIPVEYYASSGGLLKNTITNSDNTKTWHYATTYELPTYLISASIGKYVLTEDTYDGISNTIPISFQCSPSDTSKIPATFINLKEILSIYENSFGAYPFERVGYTATSIGAMEHSANISYPTSGWNGNLNLEWWYAHELAHSWFGNAVTCKTAGDMWINEGWAVWCESLYKEFLYGKNDYKNNIRKKLLDVILKTHKEDGGYYSVANIPDVLTYGSTVYNKGGQVVHNLRGYLGDDLFFSAVKDYINQYKYKNISTEELRDFLTSNTGVNMNDFFDTWLFSPGFPNFSIDSAIIKNSATGANVDITFRQRLKNMDEYSKNNHLEVTFVSPSWQFHTDTVIFSGENHTKTFQVPFVPEAVILDYNEKMSDASIKQSVIINKPQTVVLSETYLSIVSESVQDSALIMATHHWVAPDTLKNPINGLRINTKRYWKIDGILPNNFKSKTKFPYVKGPDFEGDIILNSKDSIVLMYRENANHDWKTIKTTKEGGWTSGYLVVDELKQGEYTLAVYDFNAISNKNKDAATNRFLNIFPNPSSKEFSINSKYNKNCQLQIFDQIGKIVHTQNITSGESFLWKPNSNSSTFYICKLIDENNNCISSEKIMFIK